MSSHTAQTIVQEWMHEQHCSVRELGRRAGLQPSVISRFLDGGRIETGSALRLFQAMHNHLDTAFSRQFLEATGLGAYVSRLRDQADAPLTPLPPGSQAAPQWEQARRIVSDWLTTNNTSVRGLAAVAGVQPSILSRFLRGATVLEAGSSLGILSAMYKGSETPQSRAFMQATGVAGFLALMRDKDAIASPLSNIGIGQEWLVQGGQLFSARRYLQGVAFFQEHILLMQSQPRLALEAMMQVVLGYTEAGEYNQALAWIRQTAKKYKDVLDAPARQRLYELTGRNHFYRGAYAQAAPWFLRCIKLGQQTGLVADAETSMHFLGRTYFELVKQTVNTSEKLDYLQQAHKYFEMAATIHIRWGPQFVAYDRFRQAQLFKHIGEWRQAQELRQQAKQLFGRNSGGLDILLEEAQLALTDGETKTARRNAIQIFEWWANVRHYARMARALQTLALSEYIEGKLELALEHYIVAWCLYPSDVTTEAMQLQEEIEEVASLLARQQGQKPLARFLVSLEETFVKRESLFLYLEGVPANHLHTIDRKLHYLQTLA